MFRKFIATPDRGFLSDAAESPSRALQSGKPTELN